MADSQSYEASRPFRASLHYVICASLAKEQSGKKPDVRQILWWAVCEAVGKNDARAVKELLTEMKQRGFEVEGDSFGPLITNVAGSDKPGAVETLKAILETEQQIPDHAMHNALLHACCNCCIGSADSVEYLTGFPANSDTDNLRFCFIKAKGSDEEITRKLQILASRMPPNELAEMGKALTLVTGFDFKSISVLRLVETPTTFFGLFLKLTMMQVSAEQFRSLSILAYVREAGTVEQLYDHYRVGFSDIYRNGTLFRAFDCRNVAAVKFLLERAQAEIKAACKSPESPGAAQLNEMFGPGQTPERYFLLWAKPASMILNYYRYSKLELVELVELILTYFPLEETAISSIMADPERFIKSIEK